MTGMDSAFLAETPDMHLHVIGTLLLDVSAVPLLAGGAAARVGGMLQLPRALGGVMWAAGAATRAWVEQRVGGTGALVVAPRAPFNGSLTPRRAFGTTVNDVVLAATAAALRGYLLDVGPDLAPDPGVITAGFEAGVAELVAAAVAAG